MNNDSQEEKYFKAESEIVQVVDTLFVRRNGWFAKSNIENKKTWNSMTKLFWDGYTLKTVISR
jgi:hypothetical protein